MRKLRSSRIDLSKVTPRLPGATARPKFNVLGTVPTGPQASWEEVRLDRRSTRVLALSPFPCRTGGGGDSEHPRPVRALLRAGWATTEVERSQRQGQWGSASKHVKLAPSSAASPSPSVDTVLVGVVRLFFFFFFLPENGEFSKFISLGCVFPLSNQRASTTSKHRYT